MLIEMFDECHVVIINDIVVAATEVVAAAVPQGGGLMQYREFSNTKPLEFNMIQGPDHFHLVDLLCGWVFLYMFLSGEPEGQIYVEPSVLRREGVV